MLSIKRKQESSSTIIISMQETKREMKHKARLIEDASLGDMELKETAQKIIKTVFFANNTRSQS